MELYYRRSEYASRPDETGTALLVRLQPNELKGLDAWIDSHSPRHRPPSRPAAVRWLVSAALRHIKAVRAVASDDPASALAKASSVAGERAALLSRVLEECADLPDDLRRIILNSRAIT